MLRIALAQLNPTVGALKNNKQKILQFCAEAEARQADLVVFPEMALCGYPPEDLLLKKHFVKENKKALTQLSREIKKCRAVIGFVDEDKGKIYNAAAVISDGKIKGVYHKENLPNYGVFDERRYFEPGGGNPLFRLGEYVIGLNICEDIWIKQGVCDKQVRDGADFLINISASPYNVGKYSEREKMLKARAKAFKRTIVYVNLVGGQDELVFDGGSMVVDSQGHVTAWARQLEEDLLVLDVPLKKHRTKIKRQSVNVARLEKQTKVPINPELPQKFSSLERIYKALVLGTHDYMAKNNFQQVVIGLSGGIDSALVAAVAVDALGVENVTGVTMPSKFTSRATLKDAKKLADNLGIECLEIPIHDCVNAYSVMLKEVFKGTKSGTAEENIQARIRGNILMALSNKFGWLVLTTGNKSELAVGYCTLYGDMSGGFAVIKDVPKTCVYELAKLRNTQSKVIPPAIIKRPPSAELRPNQKDQDSLPEYDVLDDILSGYVERHEGFATLSKRKDARTAQSIITLIDRNEYKRRQSSPGIKITSRAFGKDWRLPITNGYKEF